MKPDNTHSICSLISRHRSFLMGLAALWIMIYHAQIPMGSSVALLPLKLFKWTGYFGVDIFFFLSGFSCAMGSHAKWRSPIHFFKRRALRLFPIYWICVMFELVMRLAYNDPITFTDELLRMTGISFFTHGHLYYWFVPSIVVCYLIFPSANMLCNAQTKVIVKIIIIYGIIPIGLSIAAVLLNRSYLVLLLARIPSFVLGIFFGSKLSQTAMSRPITAAHVISFCAGTALCVILFLRFSPEELSRLGLWWYPGVLLSGSFCVILCAALPHGTEIDNYHPVCKWTYEKISILGTMSLPFYMIHIIIFRFLPKVLTVQLGIDTTALVGNWARIPEHIIYCILVIVISGLLQNLSNKTVGTFEKVGV